MVQISTYEFLNQTLFNQDHVIFNKFDSVPFIVKIGLRFGAATFSLVLAQALFYPFDTVKRCLQLNASKGHKNLYTGSLLNCLTTIVNQQGIARGLYSGFSLNLVRCLPLNLIHFIVFNVTKQMAKPAKEIEWNEYELNNWL